MLWRKLTINKLGESIGQLLIWMTKEKILKRIAGYMEISAETAPKSAGIDSLVSKTLVGENLKKLGEKMLKLGEKRDDEKFVRDGNNLLNSSAVLIVGSKEHKGLDLDCGACGFKTCEDFNKSEKIENEFLGPNCAFKLLDLGIALGSAAKTASIHNVDSRIMYRIGVAAKKLNILNASVIMGIPISGKHKNPYFDR